MGEADHHRESQGHCAAPAVRAVLVLLVLLPLIIVACGQPSADETHFTNVKLNPGERFTLQSGLSLALPHGRYGEVSYAPAKGEGASLAPESVLIFDDDVSIVSLRNESEFGLAGNFRKNGALAARSADGTVEVWWAKSVRGVLVLVKLPGKLEGVIAELYGPSRTRAAALREAERLWALYSIEGAELPTLPSTRP